MTKLLIHLLFRDPESGNQSQLRERYGKLVGWVGVATNPVLFFARPFAGLVSHNIAIMAGAFNNLMDSAFSLVTLFGFYLSVKPADVEHPYGHAWIEYTAGMVVSLLAVMVGFQLVQTSVGKILDPRPMEFGTALLIVLIASVLLKIWQDLLYRKISRTIDSTALLANSRDSRNDTLSTGAILISLLISYFTGRRLDSWLGLGVAASILVAGFRLVIEIVNSLLGLAPSKGMVDDIYRRILPYFGIIGLYDLNIHNHGPDHCFISIHREMCADRNTVEGHEIIDRIERDFPIDSNIHLVIHLDPVVTDDKRANRLRVYVEENLRVVSDEITTHDFQAVWKPKDSRVIFDIVVSYRFFWSDERLTGYLSEKIKSQEPQCESIITVDHSDSPPPRER